jgi:hypothetical protein
MHLAVACPSWQSPAPCPANQSLEFRGLSSGGLLAKLGFWVVLGRRNNQVLDVEKCHEACPGRYQTRRPAVNSVIDAANVFPGRIRTSTVGAKLTINT